MRAPAALAVSAILLGSLGPALALERPGGTPTAGFDVCPVGCAFASVQAAVDAAPPGATVRVGPGVYEEHVVVSKALRLEGAQAGVPAPGREGEESVLRAPGSLAPTLALLAPGARADGLTLRALPGVEPPAAMRLEAPGPAGAEAWNTIVEGHARAAQVGGTAARLQGNAFLAAGPVEVRDAAGAVVRENAFEDSIGTALAVRGGTQGLLVSLNTFRDGDGTAVVVERAAGSAQKRDARIAFNVFERNLGPALALQPGAHEGSLDATRNWWALPIGPVPDPLGELRGSAAMRIVATLEADVGSVRFVPWCPNPPCGEDEVCWGAGGAGSLTVLGTALVEPDQQVVVRTSCAVVA